MSEPLSGHDLLDPRIEAMKDRFGHRAMTASQESTAARRHPAFADCPLLVGLPATGATCESLVLIMENMFPKSPIRLRPNVALAQLTLCLDGLWNSP
jgi:hypothetical protein